MTVYVSIFKRGFHVRYNEVDVWRSFGRVYLSFAWLRKHGERSEWALQSTECGGIEFAVYRKGRVQGWRLRGPVEHFGY